MRKRSTARGALLVVDDQGAIFRGTGHTGVIRSAGVLEGEIVATGAEDGQVCLWRLMESRQTARSDEPVHLGKILGQSDREERRFRPY